MLISTKRNMSTIQFIKIFCGHLINSITRWYEKWVECNKLDRPNIDIIASIYNNIQGLNIDFHHVFGHTKNNDKHSKGNDRADNLARKSVYEHLNQPKKIPNGQL